MAGTQQARLVPISGTVQDAGTNSYQGTQCNIYNVTLTSTNGGNQSVSLSVPTGCWVSVANTTVGTNGTLVTVYVPTTNTGGVDLTVSETNFSPTKVTVQQAN